MQARDHLHLMSPFRLLAAAATPRVLALPRPAQAALLAWALLMPALHRGFIRDTAGSESASETRRQKRSSATRSDSGPRATAAGSSRTSRSTARGR